MTQFSLRALLSVMGVVCIYASLVPTYGFGRAIVCLLTILLGLSSLLFFATTYHSAAEEHARIALATSVLGALILAGSLCIGAIVFQLPLPTATQFPSLWQHAAE